MLKNINSTLYTKQNLLAIFDPTLATGHETLTKPNEYPILELFISYFNLKLLNQLKHDPGVLRFNKTELDKMKKIYSKLELWLSDLKKIESVNEDTIKIFARELRNRLCKADDTCILPCGFAGLLMDEETAKFKSWKKDYSYGGAHSAGIIITNDENNGENMNVDAQNEGVEIAKRTVYVVDPLSPYVQQFNINNKDLSAFALVIENVPLEDLTINFLEQLVTLKAKPASAGTYDWCHFYEVLLAKLNGNICAKRSEEIVIPLEDTNIFNSSWLIVKTIFKFLIIEAFGIKNADSLCNTIYFEFKFVLLNNFYELYEHSDKVNSKDFQYIINEMCANAAYDLVNIKKGKKSHATAALNHIQEQLKGFTKAQIEIIKQNNTIKKFDFHLTNYLNFANLINQTFVLEKLEGCINKPFDIAKMQQSCFMISTFESFDQSLERLNKYLERIINNYYDINSVLQVADAIEEFILNCQKNDLDGSYFNTENASNSCEFLYDIAGIYYNCAYRISCELYMQERCYYEPFVYTKLILVMFSIYAIIHVIAKRVAKVRRHLDRFELNISNGSISLKSVINELTLPSIKWYTCAVNLKRHFCSSNATGTPLFSFLNIQKRPNSDTTNTDVIFALGLVKNEYPHKYLGLQERFSSFTYQHDNKKWHALSGTDQYLPDVVCKLRNSSYLATFSLVGFSTSVLQKSNAKTADPYKTLRLSICETLIKISNNILTKTTKHCPKRFTNFILPNPEGAYQRLIKPLTSDRYFTQNEIISTQNRKPEDLSKHQYFTLGFIQADKKLKYVQLYGALKNKSLCFDLEEHLILMKQVIFKSDKGHLPLLDLNNESIRHAIVRKLIRSCADVKEKITKTQCLTHIIEMLVYLYDYCSDEIKAEINNCLKEIRQSYYDYVIGTKRVNVSDDLEKNLGLLPLLSAQCILTCAKVKKFEDNDFEIIVACRILIEKFAKSLMTIPSSLYFKMMQTMILINKKSLQNLDQNVLVMKCLNFLQVKNWISQSSITSLENYKFVPLTGRIYLNGKILHTTTADIFQHRHYVELYGRTNIIMQENEIIYKEKRLTAYNASHRDSQIEIVTFLHENRKHLWIKEKQEGEVEFETFVPKEYLNNTRLPPMFIGEYTHWWKNNELIIKGKNKIPKYIINLRTCDIYSVDRGKIAIVFNNIPARNGIYKILYKLEDPKHILGYLSVNKDESREIELPRLNLSFHILNNKMYCNELKGYHVSECQQLHTLIGLSEYLVVEYDSNIKQMLQSKLKVIIPFRNIRSEANFRTGIEFDMEDVLDPAYFTYDLDDNLEQLKPETVAGTLYLALLYFKLACLHTDVLTNMNNYEIVAELLDTCKQNLEYNDAEFHLILLLFEFINYTKPSNLETNETLNLNLFNSQYAFQHRNSIAIWLKLICLLKTSYQNDFLYQHTITNEWKRNVFKHIYDNLYPNYIAYYSVFKDRIHMRCRLTTDEEELLCGTSQVQHNIVKMEISEDAWKQKITIKIPKDYRLCEYSVFSLLTLRHLKYRETLEHYFKQNDNKKIELRKLIVGPNIRDWSCTSFSVNYFPYLYQLIFELESGFFGLNRENYHYFLSCLALNKKSHNLKPFIHILYLVSMRAKLFNKFPEYLMIEFTNYNHNFTKFSNSHIPSLDDCTVNQNVWELVKEKYLDHNDVVKYTYAQLQNNELEKVSIELFSRLYLHNLQAIQRKIDAQELYMIPSRMRYTSKDELAKELSAKLYKSLKSCRMNYDFYQHLFYIAAMCDSIKVAATDFCRDLDTIDENEYKCEVDENLLINLFTENVFAFGNQVRNTKRTVQYNNTIDKFYDEANEFFTIEQQYPEKIPFPLSNSNLTDGCPAKVVFSDGYGKQFIRELEESYDNCLKDSGHRKSMSYKQLREKLLELERQMDEDKENNIVDLSAQIDSLLKKCGEKENAAAATAAATTSDNSKATNDKFGYLQTVKTKYELKTGVNEFKQFLDQMWKEYYNISEDLWGQIDSIIHHRHYSTELEQVFSLHKLSGKQIIPTKKDILRLIDNRDLGSINPFIPQNIELICSAIADYLALVTLVQQIERAITLCCKYEELDSEIEKIQMIQDIGSNILSRRCYDYKKYPAWLLFEFENNILIRKNQEALLTSMFEETDNGIYQLNMGEGKTSVILILLSYHFANQDKIIRINCLEPLIGVMQELLRNKFSGLLRKRVYTMPFSRSVDFSLDNLRKIQKMFSKCIKDKSVILTTPEYRLCYQLKWQEMLLEYLNTMNADNKIDWSLITKEDDYSWLKELMIKLRYINETGEITKFPNDLVKFRNEIVSRAEKLKKLISSKTILEIYTQLRNQSISFKATIQNKLEILHRVDKFKFLDILDESDEILKYGKELNYTLGCSTSLDGGNIRWEVPLTIFRILFCDSQMRNILRNGVKENYVVFQENWRPASNIGGGVPYIRFIVKSFFTDQVRKKLSEIVCKELLKKFSMAANHRTDITGNGDGTYQQFILGELANQNENEGKEKRIIEYLRRNGTDLLSTLLLAKAWLAHDLLYHVMSYRYRVDYGLLDEGCDINNHEELAIPFKGKDLPSERSEFSHPEIMIGFTILSYLYRGLNLNQLKESLHKLKTYANIYGNIWLNKWTEESKTWINEIVARDNTQFPNWLRSYNTFDFDNSEHVDKAWLYLSRNISLISYHLSNYTFPHNVKHFKRKISANAHNLAGEGAVKGFSGTDDRNDTMPDSITSKKLPTEFCTNGKMIHILLREKNKMYRTIQSDTSTDFLRKVCEYANEEKRCCILIDSGAVVTELTNIKVASYLNEKLDSRFHGIVYCSDDTAQLTVMLRSKTTMPLATCHIDNKNLFYYLDEVHTRGIDLKLPYTAHGILTVGRQMTKDKLMQAAMRLRQLDYQQSVVVWGTQEITSDISNVNNINENEITSEHVLIWIVYNTIQKNQKDIYPVTLQKCYFIINQRALQYQKKFVRPIKTLIEKCETFSSGKIEELYMTSPIERNPFQVIQMKVTKYLESFWLNLTKELESHKEIEASSIAELTQDVEADTKKVKSICQAVSSKLPEKLLITEGDLDCTEENEREIEEMQIAEEIIEYKTYVPKTTAPWDYESIFYDNFVENLTKKGVLKSVKSYFENTNLKMLQNLNWRNIYVTQNFIDTIELDTKKSEHQTDHLRPVNFVLIVSKNDRVTFILVSGFEAEELLKVVQRNSNACLMHINDINGPSLLAKKEDFILEQVTLDCVCAIKLLNGETRFDSDEIAQLTKLFGILDIDKCGNQTYLELERHNYVHSGFMTHELAIRLSTNTPILSIQKDKQLKTVFERLLKESLVDSYLELPKLPENIKKIITMRGRLHEYKNSDLKRILEPMSTN